MKKNFSFALTVIMVLSSLLSVAGCGDKTQHEKEKILGIWKCELDFADQIHENFAAAKFDVEISGAEVFKLDVYMEFCDDDTYKLWIDEQMLNDEMDNFIQSMAESLFCYMEELILVQNGTEMSIDEILETAGISKEELVEQMFPEETVTALKNQIIGGFRKEGRFEVEEGKLYTSVDLEHAVDPEVYEVYTLDEVALTLQEYVGPEPEKNSILYPMIFTKQ